MGGQVKAGAVRGNHPD